MIAIPGPGKTEAAFRQDDLACRVAAAPLPGDPASSPAAAYFGCMSNRDNIIQPLVVARPLRPHYPVGDYGGDYYPWVTNNSVSFGSSH